ncbi:MAG TPA: phenylalanine--tRNA ligase subunit alpha [Candidatus Marinimicrobia bacterium]|nr:phenylalanine--tRNA ligase subunit alpha [Candidatus Neomarinimicrobiota bacterium]
MSILESIKSVRNSFRADIDSFPTDPREIESLRTKYFGRKGLLAGLYSTLAELSISEKPAAGQQINSLKNELQGEFDRQTSYSQTDEKGDQELLDLSLPGLPFKSGSVHPLQQTLDEIKSIFKSVGFKVAYGPEIEDDYHNFEALNIPKHHPARDMQDTFFITDNMVLRTHTSNVQIHLMENREPPLRYVVPGRVYRNEAVSYKSYCLFHQIEGLYVDKHVSMADLKGIIDYFVKRFFGENTQMRFRPSYFPFTEPSAEVDIWDEKRGKWMEILGCGMVDPNVFDNIGYDSSVWHGYAFGMGIERMTMLKFGIDDIRLFYQNDVRFLEQF